LADRRWFGERPKLSVWWLRLGIRIEPIRPGHPQQNGQQERMHLTQGIPEPHYPFHDRTVVVTCCGRLCLHRKKINLSTSLAGQAVGVKEVDTGIWLVSFMDYDVGYVDLEEKTLQPLENPFEPKVLPMS
jgi:hypothetical protein